MKRILLVFCLSFAAVKGFSQQFSQYNTGTLYDSFENPSQRSFIPDTSRQYASNFFIPNLNANLFLTGDAQATVVSRVFNGKFNDAALQIGANKFNKANVNANVYAFMLKSFTSLNGDVEMGFFAEAKAEGRGIVSDESVALLNGTAAFPDNTYDNIFNNHYYYQTYDAVGFSYREKIDKHLAFGFKVSALLGIQYTKLDIDESHISFDNTTDEAILSLRGKYQFSQGPGKLDTRSFLPTTRSPGAQISMGTSYRTDEGITFQANIKDLGFIHWYNNSTVYNFDGSGTIENLSGPKRENSIYNAMINIAKSGGVDESFTSPTDGKFEVSATKTFFLDDDKLFKYYPTLIAQKELFYDGYTGAMVNRFQYKNYNVSVLGSYDNLNLFNIGMQFMFKSNNFECYLGSERLLHTVSLAMASSNSSSYTNGAYTGADFFLGFALKFGHVIEHPLNSSTMPNGERGFFGRLYNRLFKTDW